MWTEPELCGAAATKKPDEPKKELYVQLSRKWMQPSESDC